MKREELVAARLPRQLVKALRKIEEVEQSDRSAVVRRLLYSAVAEWKRDYAAKLYGERKLTLERAAVEAEVSVREMMEYVRHKKVPGHYDLSELEEDLARCYKKVALSRSLR
jgi:predicted HTH domain antitoxin